MDAAKCEHFLKKYDTSVDPKQDAMAKKGNNNNWLIGWLTGWLAASLILLHLPPRSISGPKCCPGARGRALRARPRAPMLVVPWCCYLAAKQTY